MPPPEHWPPLDPASQKPLWKANISEKVWALVQDCWQVDPKDRIDFRDIFERLEEIGENDAPAGPASIQT